MTRTRHRNEINGGGVEVSDSVHTKSAKGKSVDTKSVDRVLVTVYHP